MTSKTLRRLAFASVSALALIATAAADQAWAQADASDEIIVTARKRGESLLDVPFSVNALSEEQLRARGAATLEELSKNVAGFSVQNLGPGQSQVAIRGISAGQIVRDQPGVKEQVGVYLDESVISLSLFTPDLDLFDLNRVEVLRGPQGTLFGSGSLAGTVRYITNQPSTDGFEGAVEGTISSVKDGEIGGDLKGMLNIPMSDRAAFRIVAFASDFPGYIDAIQPGGGRAEDVNGGTRSGVRAAAMFKLSEALTVTPRIVWQDIEVNGFNRVDVYNYLGNQYTTTRPAVRLGDLEQFTQFGERFTDEFLLADLTIAYDFGGLTLTSISSLSDREVLVYRDATALTGSITGGSLGLAENVFTLNAPLIDTTSVNTFTQEVRLSSDTGGRVQWVVGAFYSDQERNYAQDLQVRGFSALTGIPTASVRAPTDSLYFSTVPYDLTQYAIFGEATYAVNDKLNVTAGVRYANYEESRLLTFDGIFADQTIDSPGSVEDDDIAPRVMASYKLSDTLTLNAQASKGFRLGGVNDPLNRPLCNAADFATFNALSKPTFENETVWNYEAGLKARLAGRGSFTVAGFYSDIENLQATIDAGTCSSRIIANVPSARSIGLEAEYNARYGDHLDVAVSASYNQSELTSSVVDSTGAPIQGLRDGNRLPTVPEFQAAASVTWTQPVRNNLDGFISGTWQYVGERFTQISDQENNPRTVTLFSTGAPSVASLSFPLELPDYHVLNLRAGVRAPDGWEAAVFVNNVTDERARLSIDRERGLRARYGYQTNQPRTIGLTVRTSF
ncbi:MAG: TonB-dependent receptor [Hyphomonadaceae bacterium]|nr:TonB-dependent receptor [Hyphomonadaceae bacterium]